MEGRDIRSQKLLYHLTAVRNLPNIFRSGLLPRAKLQTFIDVADNQIILKRRLLGLDKYVPFHWFACNPFDGIVQASRPDETFALIAVRRDLAKTENWKIIPHHPLATEMPQILDYAVGFESIDWELMNKRNYRDAECKSVCMAECCSPNVVLPNKFFSVFVPNQELASTILSFAGSIQVKVNQYMFNR